MKSASSKFLQIFLLLVLVGAAPGLCAQGGGQYELTGRLNLVGSSGKPTNDVLGYGIAIHRRINDDWYLGINFDHSPEFDFERPAEILDIKSDSEIDAVGTMTMLSVIAERRFALDSDSWSGFWNLGAGINDIDMDDADGAIRGGGTYDIETDIDTELILLGGVGLLQQIGENWTGRYQLTAEHHSGDWDIRDRISGATGKIDDYAIYGLRIGLSYRF